MPELPEVETIRRDLEKKVLKATIKSVVVKDPFVLRTPVIEFTQRLTNQTIKAISRRGKALIIQTKDTYLVIQLMMTGQVIVGGTPDKYTRVIMTLKDGRTVSYRDVRRFGQLRTVTGLDQVKHFSILGPEPFGEGYNPEYIFKYTRGSKRPVKNLLLDHTFVAGIGNIYACETLFRAKINPKRLAGQLTKEQAKNIYANSVEVLDLAIKHRGSSMRDYRDASGKKGAFTKLMKVYARQGLPCVVCKTPIARIVQAGRSTFFCPHCQK